MRPTSTQKSDYFKKIGFFNKPEPTLQTLIEIVEGHCFTFPFETLNVHDSKFDHRPNHRTSLNFNQLHHKLVHKGRGGRCVELNYVLQTILQEMGFHVTPILADDLFMSSHLTKCRRPKHSAAIVNVEDQLFLVDSAFGGIGLLSPIDLSAGETTQYSEKFRVIKTAEYSYALEVFKKGRWVSLYGFENQAATLKNYRELNARNANTLNKGSLFKTFFACTKPTRQGLRSGRITITDETLSISNDNVKIYTESITSQEQLLENLKVHFNIDIKESYVRFSKVDMLAYQQGIKQPPHDHSHYTRLVTKYEQLKADNKRKKDEPPKLPPISPQVAKKFQT